MSALSGFRVAEGEFAGAFLMDDKDNDMRKFAGMGACDCCDYVRPLAGDIVVLMEETDLMRTVWGYQDEFDAAPPPAGDKRDKSANDYIGNRVMWENRLKVYGGLLVLLRGAEKCAEFAAMIRGGKKIRFLLVDSGKSETDSGKSGTKNAVDSENWRRKFRKTFRSMFSPEMIDRVNVIRLADLAEELSEN